MLISSICALAKVSEKVVANNIVCYLETDTLLNTVLHGFRANKPTETACADLLGFIYSCVDENQGVIAVFFDLSEAFDPIISPFHLPKAAKLGFLNYFTNWFNL